MQSNTNHYLSLLVQIQIERLFPLWRSGELLKANFYELAIRPLRLQHLALKIVCPFQSK
jgi:hypothetical protein